MQKKSLVSFLRKEFGLKGKSRHDGRGAWEMFSDEIVTFEDMMEKINNLRTTWKGIEIQKETNDIICIVFPKKTFNENYRRFYMSKKDIFMFQLPRRFGTMFCAVTFSL